MIPCLSSVQTILFPAFNMTCCLSVCSCHEVWAACSGEEGKQRTVSEGDVGLLSALTFYGHDETVLNEGQVSVCSLVDWRAEKQRLKLHRAETAVWRGLWLVCAESATSCR
jgi:hypothetical protein